MNRILATAAGLMLGGATWLAAATADEIEDSATAVYVEHQYTAELDLGGGAWRLMPLDAADQIVYFDVKACAGTGDLPAGVWYLRTDRVGRTWLLPPSSVDGRIVTLKPCGAAVSGELGVPSAVLDWLRVYSGAIHVRP